MADYRQLVFIFVSLNCISVHIAKSVSSTCNADEFLQAETGSCVACTVCDIKLELVTWIPCANDSDTICGPQLNLVDPTNIKIKSHAKHNIVLNDNGSSTEVKKWKTMAGVLIGVGFTCVIVVVTVCVLPRRRRRDSQWKKLTLCPYNIRRDEGVRSIQEIAEDREIIIQQHGNTYVKTEDILTTTCPLQSTV